MKAWKVRFWHEARTTGIQITNVIDEVTIRTRWGQQWTQDIMPPNAAMQQRSRGFYHQGHWKPLRATLPLSLSLWVTCFCLRLLLSTSKVWATYSCLGGKGSRKALTWICFSHKHSKDGAFPATQQLSIMKSPKRDKMSTKMLRIRSSEDNTYPWHLEMALTGGRRNHLFAPTSYY